LVALSFGCHAVSAADWKFYGNARFATFYIQQGGDVPTNNTNVADSDLEWALQGNSRIGAIVESGAVGGRFEFGASGGNANIRILYGTWDYGKGLLLIGQDFTPITSNISSQVVFTDQAMYNIGDPFAGRQPQFKWKIGEFQLALIEPNIVPGSDIVGSTFNTDTDSLIPKIEIAYRHGWDNSHIRFVAGYQTYDLVNASNQNVAIDSFLFGVHGKSGFGAGHVTASVYYGQNLGTYGATESGRVSNIHFDNDLPRFEGNALKDSRTWVAALVFAWKFTERFGFETGSGHRWMETDTSVSREQRSWVIYAQMPVMLASSFVVTPEVGYYDFGALEQGPSKQPLGHTFYAGAKWQINF